MWPLTGGMQVIHWVAKEPVDCEDILYFQGVSVSAQDQSDTFLHKQQSCVLAVLQQTQ